MERFLCVFSVVVCLLPFNLFGEPASHQKTWGYAESLYQEGEYFRAITEFKRALYQEQNPKSPLAWSARLWIIKSYLAGGEGKKASKLLAVAVQEPEAPPVYWVYLGIARLDRHKLQPFSLRTKDIKQAIAAFKKVPPTEANAIYLHDFVEDWEQSTLETPYYPSLAGGLSAVIPGAGSGYTGRWVEGAYAFLITTLFSAAALQTSQAHQPALATLFGSFGLAFYGGNIYAAVNSAHKSNDLVGTKHLQTLRQKHGIFFTPNQPVSRF